PPKEVALKLAIVGRRNVGKSTFINTLADAERVIVSEVAGTTRDSIDVRFERDGKAFLAIDTAGVRKKQNLATDTKFYTIDPPGRRRISLLRPALPQQPRRQATRRVHRRAEQAGGLRRQQVGPDEGRDPHGEDGELHSGDVPDARPRAHGVHHGDEGKERPAV